MCDAKNPSLCHSDTTSQSSPGGDFEVERMFEMQCRSSDSPVMQDLRSTMLKLRGLHSR
jgi:hypothetical protein